MIHMAVQNGLGSIKVNELPDIRRDLSNGAEFLPGMPKSWALSLMTNDADAPIGRSAGLYAWAGLGDLYFWIDLKTGIAGFWGPQILLPVIDTAVSKAFTPS